jgi:hypothetical protein
MDETPGLIKKKYPHLPALALIILSILVKTIWLITVPNKSILMENDSVRYLRISENFWPIFFGSDIDSDSFFITPGYPLYLSLFPSENFKSMVFCQFLLLGISQFILFRLVLRHTSLKIAYFGLMIFLLESSSGLESFNILTETLFSFFFILFLFLFGNGDRRILLLFTSGFVLGMALIIRPVGQILIIPLLLMFAFRTGKRQLALVLLIAVTISSTWVIRNQVVFGVPQLSGIQSLNLLQFEGAGAFAKQNNVSLKEAQTRESKLEINKVGESPSIQSLVEYRVDRGIELISANPLGFIELHVEGAVKILFGPGSANISKLSAHLEPSEAAADFLKAIIVLMRLFVFTLVCISIYFALRKKDFVPIQFYSIVSWILVLISSGGANAYSRFRVPLIPLEIMIICVGLSSPTQRAWLERHINKVKVVRRKLIQRAKRASLSADIMRTTGAQVPSGIPYVAPIVESKRPSRRTRKPYLNSAQKRC